MQELTGGGAAKIRDGNQTLARGLRVLLAIADSRQGLTVLEVGELLGVHRSIAYRLLQTLVDFGLVAKGQNGLYVPGARLATLAEAFLPTLRDVAAPVMRTLADRLQSTVSLFVEQGDEAVAIAMVEPTTAVHHIAFKPGMRTPLDRGAAAYAIRASAPAVADEPQPVSEAREKGFARSHSEIEADAYGVSAWIRMDPSGPSACLNLMTYSADVAAAAGPDMRDAAEQVSRLLDAALR